MASACRRPISRSGAGPDHRAPPQPRTSGTAEPAPRASSPGFVSGPLRGESGAVPSLDTSRRLGISGRVVESASPRTAGVENGSALRPAGDAARACSRMAGSRISRSAGSRAARADPASSPAGAAVTRVANQRASHAPKLVHLVAIVGPPGPVVEHRPESFRSALKKRNMLGSRHLAPPLALGPIPTEKLILAIAAHPGLQANRVLSRHVVNFWLRITRVVSLRSYRYRSPAAGSCFRLDHDLDFAPAARGRAEASSPSASAPATRRNRSSLTLGSGP